MPSVSATSSARLADSSPASASWAAWRMLSRRSRRVGEVARLVTLGALRRELGEQRLEAGAELKRRLPGTALVEVGPGSQQQRLADVDPLATGEHGRQTLLGAKRLGAAPSSLRIGDLDGLLPAALRQPLTGAVSDPGDERRLAPDLVAIGIVGGDPVARAAPR